MTGLARQTNGYKFAHTYRKGVPNKVATINPGTRNFHTISSEHDLGEVTQMYGINTKGSTSEMLPRVKAKLGESQKSWDEKRKILTSCWLVQHRRPLHRRSLKRRTLHRRSLNRRLGIGLMLLNRRRLLERKRLSLCRRWRSLHQLLLQRKCTCTGATATGGGGWRGRACPCT